ncbi:MAG: RDD family protein [Planctomycetota bacterium]|nr:RDD family protein [Planctomycetota bacterium]
MAYDRKPNTYGRPARPAGPPPTRPETPPRPVPSPAGGFDLRDLETYPRDAFAGAGRRLFAFLLDCIIVMPTMLIAAWVLGSFPGQNPADADSVGLFGMSAKAAKTVSKVLQILLYDMYFTATMHRWGGTWGMKFAGMVVLGRDLAMPSKNQARGRYWANILSVLPLGLGLLAIFWNRHRRAWHDSIVGTYVMVRERVPAHIVAAASRGTRDGKETESEEASTLKALMWLILIVFAPGLIVLGLTRLLLGKLGIIKGETEPEAAKG